MLEFKMISLSDKWAEYEYYPEKNREDIGYIKFNRLDPEQSVAKRAKCEPLGFYQGPLMGRLLKYNQSGNFEQDGIVAWY